MPTLPSASTCDSVPLAQSEPTAPELPSSPEENRLWPTFCVNTHIFWEAVVWAGCGRRQLALRGEQPICLHAGDDSRAKVVTKGEVGEESSKRTE